MEISVKKGYLIVSNISGYTRFLADNELEHVNGIIKDLFDSIIPEYKKSLQISKFIGRCYFWACRKYC